MLDAVNESAAVVRPKLGASDKQRLDQFLTSVREIERRVRLPSGGSACLPSEGPLFAEIGDNPNIRQTTDEYDKGTHADLMNDLIVMALACDLTRVISYMLEDERSEYTYDHVLLRTFTPSSSGPSSGVCGEYHGSQHIAPDSFATITWWNVSKVAELCEKLAAVSEGDQTLLDHSVVFLGSGMHGENHACADLPALIVGSGGGRLRTDQHLALENRPLRDLYYTLMNGVFELGVTDFGVNRTGAPLELISELLV